MYIAKLTVENSHRFSEAVSSERSTSVDVTAALFCRLTLRIRQYV